MAVLIRAREIRERKNLRLVDVGAQFNPPKDPSQISRWELGKDIPRGDNLLRWARALGCTVEELFAPGA